MNDFLKNLAPTVASALLGPMGGVAVAAIGKILGVDTATVDTVSAAINNGKLTPDQITELKKLEMQYQADESERGFKYADLAFKDRDSARQANVTGGTQMHLFWLSLVLLAITLGTEVYILFNGLPVGLSELVTGRVLGLMDAVSMMVLAYWYGTTNGSAQKTHLLSQAEPIR